jgi:hypothetical protein
LGGGSKRLAVVLGVLLAGAVPAGGHFQTAVYTFKSCDANAKRVDPINMLFYWSATAAQTLEQIQQHSGWSSTSGSQQYFRSHGACNPKAGQRASAGSTSSRYHIRVRGTYHWAEGIGFTSVGDAHHEDFTWCTPTILGHAVDKNGDQGSGFDMGRRRLRAHFQNAGHKWGRVFWGNTRNFKQCDGDYAGSDGWVVSVRIHSNDH